MPNRYVHPFQQAFTNPVTGAPLAGGKLNFYASGTNTPLATYSDRGLTTPNSNPVVLDANGFSGNIFLQNLAYNVVLTDANNVQVWQADPVYCSDFSTFAQVQSVNGNPNGQLAGTQGSLTTPASMAWDYTNQVLYVCTQTGNAAGAVWGPVNPPAAGQTFVPAPTGRLSVQAGTPVTQSDVTGVSTIVYTAYEGNTVPIFGGSIFSVQVFASDLTLTLNASHAANTAYDIYAFLNAGVLTIVTGPAWANSAANTASRGAAAAITRLNGLWVNNTQITGRNGVNTYTIPANQATYLGSTLIDPTAGQVSVTPTFGLSRRYAVWNAYNRVPVALKVGEGGTWGVTQSAWRAFNNNANEFGVFFQGLPEELIELSMMYDGQANAIAGAVVINVGAGIGVGSASPQWAQSNYVSIPASTTGSFSSGVNFTVRQLSIIGPQTYIPVESSNNSITTTVNGGEGGACLNIKWRA